MVTGKRILRDEDISDKGRKSLTILDIIRKNGPLAKTDVSKTTGINIVTVSNYIDSYIRDGLIVQKGLDTSKGGRRPLLVEINARAGHVVGIGMNVAEIVILITDMSNKILFKLKKPRILESGEKLINYLIEVTEEAIKKSGIDSSKIKGIGIGIPGIVEKERHTVRWPRGLFNGDVSVSVSVIDMFEKRFNIPTLVDNDANAALFGEKWLTLEFGMKNIVYMYSGVGCGIMMDGRVYRGANGCAGEFFFNSEIDYTSWVKQSHDTNIWEIDLGLTIEAKKVVKDSPNSAICKIVEGDVDKVNFSTVVKALKERDPLIMKLAEKAAQDLSRRIAFLVNLLNPDIVVVGGGIEEMGTYFLESLKKEIKSIAIEEATRKLKIMPARLGEEAVALGAAALVVQDIFITA